MANLNIEYNECAPPQALTSKIDCIWTLTSYKAQKTLRIIPDGCIDLIIDLTNDTCAKSYWVGAMTKSILFPIKNEKKLLGVRFKPTAIPTFLPCSPHELTNQLFSSKDLDFDDSFLIDKLLLKTLPNKVDFISDWLIKSNLIFSESKILNNFIEKVKANPIETNIRHIANELGISRQYISRLCRAYLGLEPKLFCRILRMQNFIRALIKETVKIENWSSRAIDYGFYDQSHLINECKELLGLTPSAIQMDQFPFSRTTIKVE